MQDASDTMFESHEEYSKLLAGAHRRRVTTIAAPAAIRHLGFWNPPKIGPTEEGPVGEQSGTEKPGGGPGPIQERTATADGCVIAVYRALLESQRQRPDAFREISTNCGIARGDESQLLVLFHGGIDARTGERTDCPEGVRPDSYRAIKISLLWHRIKTTLTFELHTEFLTLTAVLDASAEQPSSEIARSAMEDPVLHSFHEAMSCLANVGTADKERCKDVHSQLYHLIWAAFDAEILAALVEVRSSLGKKFIDFRGVVLDADFSAPFSRKPSGAGTGLERASKCKIADFDSLWNFITCALPSETEFTLSRFLDDRAFYATALGVQPEVFVGAKNDPLYYLLFEDTLNPWQLGRLIYRIHRAGAARIAAIMHFEQLRRARDTLALVDSTLERAIWRMSQFGGHESNPGLRRELRKDQADVENELSTISKLKLDGTLDSRIERSRYYVNQFTRLAEGLRIKRVVGFQPYDEFVHQRMGPVFEYIDSLGRIYARVQNDRAALQGRIQTLDSLHQEQLIAEAQRIADIALSCALAPYYVGSLFAHALKGLVEERTVWLIATIFGLAMFGLIKMRPEGEPLPAEPKTGIGSFVSNLLSSRISRFALALLIAIPAGHVLNALMPQGTPPAEDGGAPATVRPAPPAHPR